MKQEFPRAWRGCAGIRTAYATFSAPWPFGALLAAEGTLEIHSYSQRILIRPTDVVQLRFYDFPIPNFVAIFRSGDYYARGSFGALRGRLLRSVIQDNGFKITKTRRFRPICHFLWDTVDYGLYNGPRLDGSIGKRHNQAEQPGAGQPATHPEDKTPVKDQPPTPTSKVSPR
jgi:hypothetical protein